MKRFVFAVCSAAWLVLAAAGTAEAQPVPWVHPDNSIHYYDAIAAPGGIDWQTAFDSAPGRGGYLATLTSAGENAFVFGLVDTSSYWRMRGTGRLAGPWLGASQYFGSIEPDSGWHWVTDEPFDFTNWSPGQPDNAGGFENALHFGEGMGTRLSTWDDLDAQDSVIRGYVRELSADSTSVGLLVNTPGAFTGYTLFANNQGRGIYLVDNLGRVVHSWRAPTKVVGALYLREDGKLSQIGNLANPNFLNGGSVSLLDWDGTELWRYTYSDSLHCLHHDAIWLPNGHVVFISWELKTRDEAIAAGRDTAKLQQNKLWPEALIEVDPATDSIVWEWHLWDHLVQDYDSTRANWGVVGDHPELADLNWTSSAAPNPADWIHANSLDYNEEFDQILFGARLFSEVWVIDHSTTTEEARGHTGGRYGKGGDLLYRWGNPQTYRRGDSTDQVFWHQHNAAWIRPGLPGEGHITVFNNGLLRPGTAYSSADEFIPACEPGGEYPDPPPGEPYGPAGLCWTFAATPPDSFYAQAVSSVQRLPNGNTLICEGGRGRFFEVGPDSQVAWSYINPVIDTLPLYQADSVPRTTRYDWKNIVHRCPRYAPDYPGLAGRDLAPGYPVERYRSPQMTALAEPTPAAAPPRFALRAAPNPFGADAAVRFSLPALADARLAVYSADGRLVRELSVSGSSATWDGRDGAGRAVGRGVYCCRLEGAGRAATAKLIKLD